MKTPSGSWIAGAAAGLVATGAALLGVDGRPSLVPAKALGPALLVVVGVAAAGAYAAHVRRRAGLAGVAWLLPLGLLAGDLRIPTHPVGVASYAVAAAGFVLAFELSYRSCLGLPDHFSRTAKPYALLAIVVGGVGGLVQVLAPVLASLGGRRVAASLEADLVTVGALSLLALLVPAAILFWFLSRDRTRSEPVRDVIP